MADIIGTPVLSSAVGPIRAASVAPYADNVNITGDITVDSVLTGHYDYHDDNSDAEGVSTFRWLSCDTIGGTYVEIVGATDLTYTLLIGDLAKYIKFEVTPVSV